MFLHCLLYTSCKADDVRFLTPQQASVVIDGLTAMRDGDRAERKA